MTAAAHEIGALSARAGGEAALVILYGAAAMLGLAMLLRRAVRRARPVHLLPSLGVSLLGIALLAGLLRQRVLPPDWASTLIAAASFFALSSGVLTIGAILTWRQRERLRDRRSNDARASERQRLLERDASGPLQHVFEELENPPIDDEAGLLAPRPPTPGKR